MDENVRALLVGWQKPTEGRVQVSEKRAGNQHEVDELVGPNQDESWLLVSAKHH
jgi:hypothetical protein